MIIMLSAKLLIYFPNVKIRNANGLTKIVDHSPSYSPDVGVNSEHFGSSFTFIPFSLYSFLVCSFSG